MAYFPHGQRLHLWILLTVGLLILLTYFGFQEALERQRHAEFKYKVSLASQIYRHSIDEYDNALGSVIFALTHNGQIRQAPLERERKLLLEFSKGLYQELHENFYITHFYFTQPDRVNQLRVHQPDRFGDTIARVTRVPAKSSRKMTFGIELGPLGAFTFHVVSPWFWQGRLIGYFELGTEIGRILNMVAPVLGPDIVFLLDERLIQSTGGESGLAKMERSGDWQQLPHQVIAASINTHLANQLNAASIDSTNKPIAIDRQRYFAGSTPAFDVTRKQIGEFTLLENAYAVLPGQNQAGFLLGLFYLMLGGAVVAAIGLLLYLIHFHLKKNGTKLEQKQREWIDAFNSLKNPIFLHDKNLNLIHANEAYLEKAGKELDDLIGQPYWRVFPLMEGPLSTCQAQINGHASCGDESELTLADGSVFASTSYSVRDVMDVYRYSIHVLHDVTEKKRLEGQLKLAEVVFDKTAEGILVTDSQGTILTVNRGFSEITGYDPEEIIGKTPGLLRSRRYESDFYRDMWKMLIDDGYWQGEIWNRRKNGDEYPEWLTITAVQDDRQQTTHYIGIFSDLTKAKSTERQLSRLSNYDSLTALPNQSLFKKYLSSQMYRADTNKTRLAVLMLDLNHFSRVNEVQGPQTGDELLVKVAQRLADLMTRLDRIEDEDNTPVVVSRFAGDKFAIVLEQMEDTGLAATVAQRLLDVFDPSFELGTGEAVFLTASIGISLYPDDVNDREDIDGLLKCSHTALSLAKQKGRNNYQFYSQEFTVAASEKARLENGLRDAIEKGELFLQYQPQVSLFDGRLLGFEALVRWLHPQSGLIPPGKFIALAEQNGLINPLGEWVMRSACQQAREWYDMGLFDGTMAVNVSGIQIQQGDIAALTRTVLAETGLDVKMLELELTESAVMESPEHALTQLNQLKSQGVSLAIDDFGTGHSSLSHLLQFPFDKLKIDRSFVKHVTTNPQDGALVQAIISMGKGMQLKILAEGIETEEQLYYLKGNGCEILQGYYFSAPVDSGQAETLLSERRKLQFSTDVEGSETATLLLVDDEVNVTSTLKRALHKQDYRILVANHAAEALQLMARHRVQVILSDQKMPEILGTELLRKVRYLYPQTIRMILSGESDIETVKEAINSGWIYKFLTKPINHEELKNNINEAFDTYWRFKQDE